MTFLLTGLLLYKYNYSTLYYYKTFQLKKVATYTLSFAENGTYQKNFEEMLAEIVTETKFW